MLGRIAELCKLNSRFAFPPITGNGRGVTHRKADLVEAIIGAVWLDSHCDLRGVERVMVGLKIMRKEQGHLHTLPSADCLVESGNLIDLSETGVGENLEATTRNDTARVASTVGLDTADVDASDTSIIIVGDADGAMAEGVTPPDSDSIIVADPFDWVSRLM
jgi:arginase family enzyme